MFKGFIRTESCRYNRNSSSREDYNHTIRLFILRLKKVGYKEGFIKGNILNYQFEDNPLTDNRKKDNSTGCFNVNTVLFYDRYSKFSGIIERTIRRAHIKCKITDNHIMFGRKVFPKLTNIISTRRVLHNMMSKFDFSF